MARSISVKVPTATLIALIEDKIASIDEAVKNYASDLEKYDKEVEAYHKSVVSLITDYVGKNLNKIGNNHDSNIRISENYGGRVDLSIDKGRFANFPERPTRPSDPNQREWFGREQATRKELLERNLKILRMTSQEEVSASTYGTVMELL